jgi:hypothetical protein
VADADLLGTELLAGLGAATSRTSAWQERVEAHRLQGHEALRPRERQVLFWREERDAKMNHIAILGLGPSVHQFQLLAQRMGGRRAFCDEVWTINAWATSSPATWSSTWTTCGSR